MALRVISAAEDMLAVRSFAGGQTVAVSPSGRWIAYALTDLNDEWNVQEPRPTSHVGVQPLGSDDRRARMLTSGTTHSAFPVWSPDGRRLAFVQENQAGGRLTVWDAQTDRTVAVGETFKARAYLAPQWHPDGRHIIFAVPLPAAPPARERVTVVKSMDARIPGDRFFMDERKAMLASIEVETGKSTVLLTDPVILRSFRLSPTGRHVLLVVPNPDTLGVIGKEQNDTFVVAIEPGRASSTSARKLDERGRFSWSPDGLALLFTKGGKLMSLSIDGGGAKPWREDLTLAVSEPIWSHDGASFATLVADSSLSDPELEPMRPGMYSTAQPFMDVYLVSAHGAALNLTGDVTHQMSDPVWSPDGSALYFRGVDTQSYAETIYRYTPADRRLHVIANGQETYGPLMPTTAGVVVAVEDATHPDDLWVFDDKGRHRLTDLNPQLGRFNFSKPELFHFHNADGERLGALLYKPAAARLGEKVPVITWVYEKMTPAIHRFNARDQMFISHGYALLMPNVKVKVGQTADSFEKCVVPAVNAVRDMGFTNGRFGLWGHSFGAYATSNLITRTDIFAAAVSGATPPELFRNWASGRDRDSRNIETGQARMGGSPFVYPERYLSQSGFFHLDKVNTPVLILHGEKDYTILFGEGEMMFYALRQLGKTAEFVAYANGDHSLSRHSRTDALDVNRRVMEWFDRYLKSPMPATLDRQD